MELDADDRLARCAHFLSTIESRNKVYRLIQYGAKMSKWTVMTTYDLKPADLKDQHQPNTGIHTQQNSADASKRIQMKRVAIKNAEDDDRMHQSARWLAAALARIESLFGDARKVYRFFQFLEMADVFRHANEPDFSVRILRRLRIVCFFFFYLLENYMVFLLRVEEFPHRHPQVVMLKRACNGFWCASIVLAFALDHLTKRGGMLSTVKKLLDLPVACIAFADKRVSDGLFGALGIASSQIGVYLRWIEVMAKLQSRRLASRAGKRLLVDVA